MKGGDDVSEIKWPCENCGGAGVVATFIDNKIEMVNCPKCNPDKKDSFELLLKQNARINELTKKLEQAEAKLAKMQNPDIEKVSAKVHDAWWEEKKAQGFHSPAEGHDLPSEYKFMTQCGRCHTDMYPYEELPENIKEYDRVTVRSVLKALAEMEGEK